MAKYRILQTGKSTFYPQEKKSMLQPWRYLCNHWPHKTWDGDFKSQSACATLEKAMEVISKRKAYLIEEIQYPIIHKQ
jgi:hypothetical protein